MIIKRGIGLGKVEVTFRLPSGVPFERVHVVGDFNGWSRTATPMCPDGDGLIARVVCDAGVRYQYRYLADGHRWANDWQADDYIPNQFGGEDSVLDLTAMPAQPPVGTD